VYYPAGERAERGVWVLLQKRVPESVVKHTLCNDRIIPLKL